MSDAPTFILVAGPNGAGKSTMAPALLRDEYGAIDFVNADDIAKGLSSFNPESVAVTAGRILLERIHQLSASRQTFATETTLSGRSYTKHIVTLKAKGYRFDLLFLWLPSSELAISRVAQRVSLGGHNIPEPVIRRRYESGISNFQSLYRPLADSWKFFDCSTSVPLLVAYGTKDSEVALQPELWHTITGEL